MKIYTKTGDKGTTSIVGGTRVSKADTRLDVYGTIDELNACLGVVIGHSTDPQDIQELSDIQENLFKVGMVFATDWERYDASSHAISEADIERLETHIDRHSATLPPLKDFVMPRGSLLASHTHVARTVCRRTERLAVAFIENRTLEYRAPQNLMNDLYQPQNAPKTNLDPTPFFLCSIQYLNRLSDYLFVLARKG